MKFNRHINNTMWCCIVMAISLLLTCFVQAEAFSVTLCPINGEAWGGAAVRNKTEIITVKRERVPGLSDLFLRIDALMLRVKMRESAYEVWLKQIGETEEFEEKNQERFLLLWQNRTYRFDCFGKLILDRRFIDAEDNELVQRFEAQYQDFLSHSIFANITAAKLRKQPKIKVQTVPIFAGFEDERYQQHDALILKLVNEFNRHRAEWAGADPKTKVEIPELSAALIKSMMLEESGGNGPRSREAWKCDPLQVNVPGDWDEAKELLGLKRPKERNECDIETNLRAGITYLVRKGFGISGKPVAHRATAYFDSWRTALKHYNGRKDALHDGRMYRVAYADRILRRAKYPNCYIPIAH